MRADYINGAHVTQGVLRDTLRHMPDDNLQIDSRPTVSHALTDGSAMTCDTNGTTYSQGTIAMKHALTGTALGLMVVASLSGMNVHAQDRYEDHQTPEYQQETEDVKIDCDALPSADEIMTAEEEYLEQIQEDVRTDVTSDPSTTQPGHVLLDWFDELGAIESVQDVSVCYPEDVNRIIERRVRPEEKIEG